MSGFVVLGLVLSVHPKRLAVKTIFMSSGMLNLTSVNQFSG